MWSLVTTYVTILLLSLQSVYRCAAVPQSAGGARRSYDVSVPEGVFNALRARGVPEAQLEPHKRKGTPPAPKVPLGLAPKRRCQWCAGLPDGKHPDPYADPPWSSYFGCANQQLTAINFCPPGTLFDVRADKCLRSTVAAAVAGSSRGDGVRQSATTMADVDGMERVGHRQLLQKAPVPKLPPVGPTWDEVNALLDLKSSNFDPANALANWVIPRNSNNNTAAVCRWYGVGCNRQGHVRNLTLDGVLLTGKPSAPGSLPPSMGDLVWLDTLDLGFNLGSGVTGLIGSIPAEMGTLTRLTFLQLSTNKLTGSLPAALSFLPNLQYVNLANNMLSGSLPSWIGSSWTSVTSLQLNLNLLNDTIPDTLSGLKNLQVLNIKSNLLTGSIPSSLSQLRKMTDLEVGGNLLSGPPPEWLASMPASPYIDLSGSAFNVPIPASWAKIKGGSLFCLSCGLTGSLTKELMDGLCAGGLSFMDLSNNSLSGDLPLSLQGCPTLSFLNLAMNNLTGDLSGFVKGMTKADVKNSYFSAIDVSNNHMVGAIPPELFLLPYMTQVVLSNNRFIGPLPPLNCQKSQISVATVASFGSISVGGNQLSGELAPNYGFQCTGMASLDLSDNKFSGSFPPTLLDLPVITTFNISYNNFTGPLPVPKQCSELLYIYADANDFSGSLPEALGTCKSLTGLGVSSNPKIVGQIPQWIVKVGGGQGMSNLNLSRTGLSGPIPGFLQAFQFAQALDLSHCNFSGPLPPQIANLSRLQFLDVSYNQLTGALSSSLGNLTAAISLSFAGNHFTGPIPAELAPTPSQKHLAFVQRLDLSHNNLSGEIPYQFTLTPSNVSLNLSYNNLTGPIPEGTSGGSLSEMSASSFEGNPALCGGPGYEACPGTSSGLSTGAIVGIVVGAVVGLLLIALLAWWLTRTNDQWAGGTMLVFEKLDFRLTVDHILQSTEHFSEKYQLGRGGFGSVYRATLQDGRTVAIKRLALGSTQGEREFQAEMQTLGNIRHRNLVTLVAAYIAPGTGSERLLVYNFLSGGSLDGILAKDMAKDSPFRKWEVRRSVALDTARGMKYLHHDCTPRIIHRDMKPANVLLDEELVARVADFGLAREVDMSRSHMSTAVFGTIGYLAPEYTQRGRLTFKSDVFAYGVLLLQLITGKQPTDEDVAERGLARWVGANSSAAVIDPRMTVRGDQMDEALGAIKLGLLCTSRVAADRPSMAEVVHVLENLEDFAKGISTAAAESEKKGQ